MGTTNTGSQTIIWDYKQPTAAQGFNQVLRGVVKPGIYKGGVLAIADTNTVEISPFVAFLNVNDSNGNNKVVRIETEDYVEVSVNPSNPIIYIKYDWLNVTENWADFGIRSSSDNPALNEVRFGLATFTGPNLTGFNVTSTYKDYGFFDDNFNTYAENYTILGRDIHYNSKHQINSEITDNSENSDATYEVKRLDDETQTHRDVSLFSAEDTIVLSGSGHGLVANDYINISGSINDTNNGEYKIDSVSNGILTVDTTYKKVTTDESSLSGVCAKLVNAKLTWYESELAWLAGYDGDGLTNLEDKKLLRFDKLKADIIYNQSISGVIVNDPVYFNVDKEIIDNCDTADWTDDAEISTTLNTTTYMLDSSLNLTKNGGASTTASCYKTQSSTLNFTSKELFLYLCIDDSTTLAKLATSNCIVIRYGSDDSNYYQWNKNNADLSVGWNCISNLTSSNADSTTGSPSITAMDYVYIALISNNASDTWASGKVIMDYWCLKSNEEWRKSSATTPTPQGIYIGNSASGNSGVILEGYTDQLNSLIPNYVYYMNSSGNLTPKITEAYNYTKLLYSISDNEAVVDIDIEENKTNIIIYGKGYCIGGYTTDNTAVIEDLIFSNETSQTITATLDTAKRYGASVNSSNKGYIMGGLASSNTAVIEDLIFSNETSQAITATLDTAKRTGTGVNSLIKGYCMGGYTSAYVNVIEDLIFSNETSQTITATLDTAKGVGAGVNSSLKGYIMGGWTVGIIAVIEDLIFSDESSQAIVATLDTAKISGTGVNSSTKGYIMGGDTAGGKTAVIEDLIFSNETSQAITATLDTAKQLGAGVNSLIKGYCMGGDTGSNTNVIEDLIFSDETSQVISATLDTVKHAGMGVNTPKIQI